jgi:uncharacterized protein YutE (UPF0331/DUF86 family)
MARLDQRIADATAALATLDELAGRNSLSLVERDGAILRLVYTFEAVWRAAALFLELQEKIAIGSPRAAIRASRRVGLLDDADAEEALRMATDRNLTVHMYRDSVGQAVAAKLGLYAAVLHRWLDALQRAAAASDQS